MSFTSDWSDQNPIDHLQFKSIPSSVRSVRIDLEDRLKAILYGFVPGEVLTGIKVMPANFQAADPGAVSGQIQIYSKKSSGISELFTQDDSGNICQVTKAGALNLTTSLPTAFVNAVFLAIHPIGDIIMNITGTNPGTTFGGTWVAWGTGQVPVGVDTGQTEFNTVEKTGGEKTHTLTTSEMPSHSHGMTGSQDNDVGANTNIVRTVVGTTATAPSTQNAGSGGAHNNLQPYITSYFWKRTA